MEQEWYTTISSLSLLLYLFSSFSSSSFVSEILITPEQFAQILCDDLELYSNTFVPAIASSIRQQLEQFASDVIPEDEEDRRVIIKVYVGKKNELDFRSLKAACL